MDHHRAGPLKQRNKPHKVSRKKAISSRNRKNSLGSVASIRSSSSLISSKSGSAVSRTVRKNQLLQARKLKREDLLNARRGIAVAPVLISVLCFGGNDHGKKLLELLQQLDPSVASVSMSKRDSARGCLHLDMHKFRTKYQLILLDKNDLNGSLDLVKISDVLLPLFNSESVDDYIYSLHNDPDFRSDEFILMDAIYNHCLPPTIYGINGGQNDNRIKKTVQEFIEKSFSGTLDGNGLKLRSLDSMSDLLQLFHHLSNIKRKPNSYCARRSQIFAEQIEFVPAGPESQLGTLLVDGYVRNSALNVNSVIYIPEFGEFLMEQIETVPDPYVDQAKRQNRHGVGQLNYCIRADPSQQQSMIKENKVETIFEEEMRSMEADMNGTNPVVVPEKVVLEKKKVPKGTSEYQAAWIFESDDDDDEGDEEDGEVSDDEPDLMMFTDNTVSKTKRSVSFAPTDQVFDDDLDDENLDSKVQIDEDQENGNPEELMKMDYDDEIDMREEQETLEKFKESRLYEQFPDEIDTPVDRPARERFAKFRGLKSFRTSEWDREENLPADYSRIFQFDNFSRTRHRLFKTDPIGADSGLYVRLTIANVPRQVYDYYNGTRPLVVFELLAHEHRMSVLNLVLKKVATFPEPIRSKERLIIHLGCRRFESRPVFSSHSIGDKHKFERFLRGDVACVATIYAPITFPPASVLVYKRFEDGSQQLVATGSLLNCSPERLIIKRLILSGHPFKINRKHAVVRYMFFNREDILWFRPIELRTKYGRKGHIQEPLGTHGHMKCIFDHQLSSQDTVLMSLYKRVFPKWHYQPTCHHSTVVDDDDGAPPTTMMEP